jgi:type I restriction enzyme, S subunit
MIAKPISKIAKRISSGLTPLRSNPDFWESGSISWLKTEQLGEKYIYETTEKISKEALKETGIKLFPPNTLSIAMYGEGKTRGNVSIIKAEMTTNQACCNVELDAALADYEYVYYYLKTQYDELRNLSSGVRKNLNSNDIKNFIIRLPEEVTEQQKIAAVLSALDAKIDCNNRINSELEAMAKTLYDYWFVQFDFPFDFVQGKPDKNGKPYKSTGGKMVYNPTLKREIPAGWEAVQLSDLVDEVRDGADPGSFDGCTPYIGLEHIARKSIVLANWSTADQAISNKTAFRSGDILFGKIRPYFHKVGLATMNGITSTDAIVMRPKIAEFSGLALETVFTDRFVEMASAASTGSKMPRADWKVMKKYGVPIPLQPSPILAEYQKLFDLSANKIRNHIRQNQHLTQLRDWLLPMLMNGQVTVA